MYITPNMCVSCLCKAHFTEVVCNVCGLPHVYHGGGGGQKYS